MVDLFSFLLLRLSIFASEYRSPIELLRFLLFTSYVVLELCIRTIVSHLFIQVTTKVIHKCVNISFLCLPVSLQNRDFNALRTVLVSSVVECTALSTIYSVLIDRATDVGSN